MRAVLFLITFLLSLPLWAGEDDFAGHWKECFRPGKEDQPASELKIKKQDGTYKLYSNARNGLFTPMPFPFQYDEDEDRLVMKLRDNQMYLVIKDDTLSFMRYSQVLSYCKVKAD